MNRLFFSATPVKQPIYISGSGDQCPSKIVRKNKKHDPLVVVFYLAPTLNSRHQLLTVFVQVIHTFRYLLMKARQYASENQTQPSAGSGTSQTGSRWRRKDRQAITESATGAVRQHTLRLFLSICFGGSFDVCTPCRGFAFEMLFHGWKISGEVEEV